MKGVPFVNRRYTKGVPFPWKMVYNRVKGLNLGAEPPSIKIHWVPPEDASSVKSCLHLPIISLILVWIVISGFVTGSRGDVFVARTSKPVENHWKNGLFWSRYSFVVTRSIYRKPREREGSQDWHFVPRSPFGRRAVRQRGYGLQLLTFETANNKVDLGQIRSEEIVYNRFIKISLG